MAGYADDFSRSRNAESAERRNCFPASRLAKRLGVSTGAVKAILKPSERHHTSGRYNTTDYYDGDLLLAIDINDAAEWGYDTDEIAEATEQLGQLRAWKPPAKQEQTWTGCAVTWLAWGGSRKRPTATEETAENCEVTWKGGKMCSITLATGVKLRKGVETRGFEVRDSDGNRLSF